jgi:4-hydroxybenzoate polyprenyltransferase
VTHGVRQQLSTARETTPAAVPVTQSPSQAIPLVADLDGTLIATDTLFESALGLIRRNPFFLVLFLAWLCRGKAFLKAEIARHFRINATSLPYRKDLLEYLRNERASGRTIILATAAHQSVASSVVEHLDLFDDVIASSDTVNLKGKRKSDELVKRFGFRGFDYIGDSRADIPVWLSCRVGHVAGKLGRLPSEVLASGAQQGQTFSGQRYGLKPWLRTIRIYQWTKNILVFVPALLNHHLDWDVMKALAIAFSGFCLVASGAYVANDLFDLDADRRHPRKQKRPLASGELSIFQGAVLSVALVLAGISLSFLANWKLVVCLLIYLNLTLLYSSFLKGKPILDVIALAVLYTLRIYSGGLATGAFVSPWLFQFSVMLFLSLAFVKRYSELRRLRFERNTHAPGRAYHLQDMSLISQAGLGSGLLAGLVLALYVNGREIAKLYPRPEMLWAVSPIFLYWIIRVWLIAHRGNMNEDPILFAFHDRVSYIVGFLIVLSVALGLVPDVY